MRQSIYSFFLFLRFPDNSWQTTVSNLQPRSEIKFTITPIHLNVRRWKAKDSFYPAAMFLRECCPSLDRHPACHNKNSVVKWCDVIEKRTKLFIRVKTCWLTTKTATRMWEKRESRNGLGSKIWAKRNSLWLFQMLSWQLFSAEKAETEKAVFFQIIKSLNIPTCCHPNSEKMTHWTLNVSLFVDSQNPRMERGGGGNHSVMWALTWQTSEKRLLKLNPQHCFNKFLKSSKILWQHQTRRHLV